MHVFAFLRYFVVLLYGLSLALTSQAEETAASAPAPEPVPAPMAQTPHVALILPLQSRTLGPAADLVKAGFVTASEQAGKEALPYIVYPTTDDGEDLLAAYKQAQAAGARLVVGPLSRPGIRLLVERNALTLPTLALNTLDTAPPAQLFLFNLSAEAEARQVARRAWQAGLKNIATVAIDATLEQRVQKAFAEEWQHLGGTITTPLSLPTTKPSYATLRTAASQCNCDGFFVAADARQTRLLRPYLPADLPIYATSQAYAGRLKSPANLDLRNLRFIDMPWLLQPDHAAVAIYPHYPKPLAPNDDRTYALGVDAWRLAEKLLAAKPGEPVELDGVTGKLTLDHGVFQRELPAAEVRNDEVVLTP